MKTRTSATTLHLPPKAVSKGGTTTTCVNLRESQYCSNPVLTMAACPEEIMSVPMHPLAKFPQSEYFLLYREPDADGLTQLYSWRENESPVAVDEVYGTPLCSATDGHRLIVMFESGPRIYSPSGGKIEIQPTENPMGPIGMSAIYKGTMTIQTNSFNAELIVSGQTAQLSDSSLKTLSSALLGAYTRLATQASADGLWLQPVGIRYRIIGAAGQELWRSPVNIISYDGWQCADSISASLSSNGSNYTIPRLGLAAKAYEVELSIPAKPAESQARAIIVEATPQLHPCDLSSTSHYKISGIASSAPALNARVPGVSTNEETNTAIHSKRIQSLISFPDSTMIRLCRIELSSMPQTLRINAAPVTPQEEINAIEKVLTNYYKENGTSTHDNPIEALIASGQPFAARCAVQNGETTVWGDITTLPDRLPNPTEYAATCENNGNWTAALRINDGDKSYVTRFSGTNGCPTSLSPVLRVPHPQATSLTLYIRNASGTIKEATVNLIPSTNSLYACHIANSLKPTTLVDSPIDTLPAATSYSGAEQRMPGALIAANSREPLRPLFGCLCVQGKVHALTTTVKSLSSWDFSRCHLYAFSSSGIYSIAVNIRNNSISAACIDKREVSSGHAVTVTPLGVIAVAGGAIVSCTASSVKPLYNIPDTVVQRADRIVWNKDDNELYTADKFGNITAISLESMNAHHCLLPERIAALHDVGNRIWLTGTDSTFGMSQNDTDTLRYIKWQSGITVPKAVRATDITIPVSASRFKGTIELRTDNGAGETDSLPVAKINIDGRLNAPIRLRIAAPMRYAWRIHISGHTSHDFRLGTMIIGAISRRHLR